MNSKMARVKYVVFLRGINVGGHHKVPMVQLQKEFGILKFENVVTLLNSGNIVMDAFDDDLVNLEKTISDRLEKVFGFAIPTIIRKFETIIELYNGHPFKDFKLTKDIRFYISFLKNKNKGGLKLPWISEDHSFQIIAQSDNAILSVVDVSISKTPKAMEALGKLYGSEITTRNWNTIERIVQKINGIK